MQTFKFKTAIICEVVCEAEYEPASGPYHDQPHYPARVSLISAKAISPMEGSEDWADLEQEAEGEVDKWLADQSEMKAEAEAMKAEMDREERMGSGGVYALWRKNDRPGI